MRDAECETLSVREVGRVLGFSRNSVYAAIKAGRLPAIRLRRKIRVPVIAVARLLEGSEGFYAQPREAPAVPA